MTTLSEGSPSAAGEPESSNPDTRSGIEPIARGDRGVDLRLAVRSASVIDTVKRLNLVRDRDDRLPAERIAHQLADEVRALEDVVGVAVPWAELADAIAAAADEPLDDKLRQVVDRLTQHISELRADTAGTGSQHDPFAAACQTSIDDAHVR